MTELTEQTLITIIGVLGSLLVATISAFLGYHFGRKKYEHETTFSQNYQKRVEIIEEIYTKLTSFEIAQSEWNKIGAGPGNNAKEQQEKETVISDAIDKFFEFKNYFIQNALYLPSSSQELINKVLLIEHQFPYAHGMISRNLSNDQLHQEFWDFFNSISQYIPELKRLLEVDFKYILRLSEKRAWVNWVLSLFRSIFYSDLRKMQKYCMFVLENSDEGQSDKGQEPFESKIIALSEWKDKKVDLKKSHQKVVLVKECENVLFAANEKRMFDNLPQQNKNKIIEKQNPRKRNLI